MTAENTKVKSCPHSWKNYQGLRENYDYCEHCGIKKDDWLAQTIAEAFEFLQAEEATKAYKNNFKSVLNLYKCTAGYAILKGADEHLCLFYNKDEDDDQD